MGGALDKQTILGKRGLMLFLYINNMFLPLSLDMYLPALPSMSAELGAPASITNLTLTVFTFVYAFSVILWGPLSDKYGRRPCVIAGAALYTAGSLLCALSQSVYLLILARMAQGVGMGAITSISVAIVKDCFDGDQRERMIARIYTISSVAPIIAPLLGGQLLRLFNWRAAFFVLTGVGALTLLLACCFRETQPAEEAYHGAVLGALRQYAGLVRDKAYMTTVVLFTISNLPFLGYIAVSSYIYIGLFRLSAQSYSLLFAFNSFVSIFGPGIYIRFFSGMPKGKVGCGFFLLSALSGFFVLLFGKTSPWAFLFAFMPFSVLYTGVYTFGVNLSLEQHQGGTGAASAMISFSSTILGAFGTALASLFTGNAVVALGVLMVVFSLLPLVWWLWFLRSGIPCKGLTPPGGTR